MSCGKLTCRRCGASGKPCGGFTLVDGLHCSGCYSAIQEEKKIKDAANKPK